MKFIVLSLMLFFLATCSDDDNPVKTQNNSPEILSLDVFPKVIGASDSVIVICNAIDPDGDTLIYDWTTDGRVKIKGAFLNNHWLYHTYENTRVFYPTEYSNTPIDTLWIQCNVRDVKGGDVAEIVHFVVKQN